MSKIEFGSFQPDPFENNIVIRHINPQVFSPDELARFASCQLSKGRQICLVRDGSKPKQLDLSGFSHYSEGEEKKIQRNAYRRDVKINNDISN